MNEVNIQINFDEMAGLQSNPANTDKIRDIRFYEMR